MESHAFKVIFLGNAGVGKTSIINKKAEGSFQYSVKPTVGCGSAVIEVELHDQTVELRVWDMAGQDRYHKLVPLYLKGASVAVLVASVADTRSIDDLSDWMAKVKECDTRTKVVVALNKIDLPICTQESIDELREKLMETFPTVLFVSAKSGQEIDHLFGAIAKGALEGNAVPLGTVRLSNDRQDPQRSGQKCC